MELAKFVQAGRHADHRRVDGDDLPRVQHHHRRHGRDAGAAVRARVDSARHHRDRKSPIAYGYDGRSLPVYFNQAPVLNAGGGGWRRVRRFAAAAAAANAGLGQNTTPMAHAATARRRAMRMPSAGARRPRRRRRRSPRPRWRRGVARRFGVSRDDARPRVVMSFPPNPNDMLLSGTLAGGQALSNRAQVVDVPLGKGHVVMFAHPPVLALADAGHVTSSASTRS